MWNCLRAQKAAALTDPHFAWFYFVNEHVLRFLGLCKPDDFRTGPFYYYLPIVLAGFLPWTGWLVPAFRRLSRADPLEKLALTWFFVFLIFFSASQAEATYYLVTALPAAALLAVLQIERCARNPRSRVNTICAVFGFAAAAGLVSWILLPFRAVLWDAAVLPFAGALLVLIGLGIALSLNLRSSPARPCAAAYGFPVRARCAVRNHCCIRDANLARPLLGSRFRARDGTGDRGPPRRFVS